MAPIIAGGVFLALGEMLAAPATTSLAIAAAPHGDRGRYVSVFQLSWTLSALSRPALVGHLLDTSLPVLWGSFTALMPAAALVLTALRPQLPAHTDSKSTPAPPPP
ncbi:hypothetical protein [Streptomyces camelliae]|uniref:Major facilitator superfamily (MFS) profile domain-containing protein n=1 Tax=Streptomyces camelliae TaxID=3004093 RepID=A0ABY7PG71_9ACTN|nr:hypothetical protein [Streptomyces sp. HUAS 2-6]WBO69623.1 hypothetical protein O1G22_43555 [Streptomyces sp. HUAS 2-6]